MAYYSFNELWDAILEDTRGSVSDIGFKTWISELEPVAMEQGNTIVLSVRNAFIKETIEKNYLENLLTSCENVSGLKLQIEIMVKDDPTVTKQEKTHIPENTSVNYNQFYTFSNFVVGASNRFAHAAAVTVAEKPAELYNPFFVYGNSGVGKTHLIMAIKNKIEELYPNLKVICTRGEEFTNSLIESIHNGTVSIFHNKFRSADVLLVDDVHFIAGKEQTQEEFFNTFDSLYQQHKQIILTSDRPPKEIKTLNERLRSRFESGLLADMSPPDFETRVGILKAKADQIGLTLQNDHIFYIAENITTNTRQLEGIIKKLQIYSTIHNYKSLSIPIIQGFIKDIVVNSVPEPITIEKIVDEVSRTYNISSDDIMSKRKTADVVYARQVALYITKEITQLSYTAIGKKFNMHHTTVMYTMEKMEKILKDNTFEKELIEDIIKNLNN